MKGGEKLFIGGSRVDFYCFWEVLGAGFLSFSALDTGLEIEFFSRSPWGSWMAAENKRTGGSAVKIVLFIRTNNLSTASLVITLDKD